MKMTMLRNYARLIARMGVNIQKGQDVIIYCQLDQPKFVELLVDECYKAGAKKVIVEFSYQPLQKLHVRRQRHRQDRRETGTVPECRHDDLRRESLRPQRFRRHPESLGGESVKDRTRI